ncbi:hypothetical protein Ahy_B10g105314 isoform A [Arachis hypogaea]|uniref:Uncharacterized protein n=1 Tax=Arachis hypogaea TaxID=3818 RepID=A0A444X7Q2_ARAHY|nr:hypothetical protein Ahy_B10g105314 isoform A [Arachis hypogaea]
MKSMTKTWQAIRQCIMKRMRLISNPCIFRNLHGAHQTQFLKEVQGFSAETHERVRNGFTYSKFATKRVEESFRRAGNIVVNRFDRRNEMFEVRKM